jgi:formyl-CoA transferase
MTRAALHRLPKMVQMADQRGCAGISAGGKAKRRQGSNMEEKGIFDGLKVLDCASFIAAPAAATVLSDFGAHVIKIEPPGQGDPYRNLPNLPGYPHSEHNFAWLLEARNKKSIALDLSRPEGQAVLHKLAAEADIFITNMPPQVR